MNTTSLTRKNIPLLQYTNTEKKDRLRYGILIGMYLIITFSGFFSSSVMTDILVFAISIYLFKDVLKRDFRVFRENWKKYVKYILPRVIAFSIFSFVLENEITILCDGMSINQQGLETLPMWYLVPLCSIWAPVVEEIVYRGALRRFFKSDKVFIIFSAFVFGVAHTLGEPTMERFLMMSIPYVLTGMFLAYSYAKTKNMMVNIFYHAFLNSYGFIINVLIFIFTECFG